MTFSAQQPVTPNAAIVMGSVGLCLIFIELNRPGRILPGALGLLLTLLATAALLRTGVRPLPAAVFLVSAAVFLLNVWRQLPWAVLLLASVAGVVALRELVAPALGRTSAPAVTTAVALVCGLVLATLSGVLSRIAYRARRSKALD